MRLVGPRLERPFFVEQFTQHIPYYTQRFSVKPGITDWARPRWAILTGRQSKMRWKSSD